jgi:hypothetical protein
MEVKAPIYFAWNEHKIFAGKVKNYLGKSIR